MEKNKSYDDLKKRIISYLNDTVEGRLMFKGKTLTDEQIELITDALGIILAEEELEN